jgi:hypothetical protein
MTRRDVFARLAGLLGVPYVAKSLPAAFIATPARSGNTLILDEREMIEEMAATMRKSFAASKGWEWEPRARIGDTITVRRPPVFHRDAFVMTWPKVGE